MMPAEQSWSPWLILATKSWPPAISILSSQTSKPIFRSAAASFSTATISCEEWLIKMRSTVVEYSKNPDNRGYGRLALKPAGKDARLTLRCPWRGHPCRRTWPLRHSCQTDCGKLLNFGDNPFVLLILGAKLGLNFA